MAPKEKEWFLKEGQFSRIIKSKDGFNQSLVSSAKSNEVLICQLKDQISLLESSDASPLSAIKIATLESDLETLRMENMKIPVLESELNALKAEKAPTIPSGSILYAAHCIFYFVFCSL